MKLQEWIDNKTQELKVEKKYREAIFKVARPAQVGRNSISFMLFDPTQIPLDAEVKELDRSSLPSSYSSNDMVEAAMVTIEVLKPRKRKAEREDFYVQLVS